MRTVLNQPDDANGTWFEIMKPLLPQSVKCIPLYSLMLWSLAYPLWAVSDAHANSNISDNATEQSETKVKHTASKDEYQWDPKRRDWENGYYKDIYSRYQPLNGIPPEQLGNGGGSPRIYFKVKQTDNIKADQHK